MIKHDPKSQELLRQKTGGDAALTEIILVLSVTRKYTLNLNSEQKSRYMKSEH